MEAHLQLCLTAQKKPPRLSSPVFAKPSVTPASKSSLSTPTLAPCTSTPEIASGSAPCISIASGSAPCNSIPSGSAPCMSTASVSAPCTSKPEIASVSAPCISIASVSALCTSAPEISSVSAPCTSSPELYDSTPSQFPLASFADRKRTTCPHCSAVMLKKNLNIHIQRKHTDHTQDVPMQSHLYGVCIDMFNGVYAVQKSGNGFSVPVHVQRKTWGKEYQLKCDLQECWENQQLAPSCEHTFSLCEHLSSLDYCCETVFEELLDPSVLDEMVKLKFFGETKKAVCLRRQKVAQTAHVPFSVLVTFGDSQKRFTLSIYEPVVNQFSRLGRVMVTYNSTAGTWDCPCAKPRMSCPHKNIAKWHLFQTNIQLFTSEIPSDEASVKELSEDLNCAIQFDLHRTVEYIYSMKKIPSVLQDGAHPKAASDFPLSLCPVESCCMMCDDDTTLELPMLTTRNAQIVTMTGVINGKYK